MRTRIAVLLTIISIAFFGVAEQVEARTWRVALDGSGDTESIHQAGLMAESGDTISIAPGEYSTLIDHNDGYTDRRLIAAIEGDKSFVIVGDHRDSVVIGPTEYVFEPPDSPVGLMWYSTGSLIISGLTLRNSYHGLKGMYGNVVASNCCFTGNRSAFLAGYQISTIEFSDCTFISRGLPGEAPPEHSLYVQRADSCTVRSCVMSNSGRLGFDHTTYVNIDNVELSESRIEVVGGNGGAIKNSVVGGIVWLERIGQDGFELRGNEFSTQLIGGHANLVVWGRATQVRAYENIFGGTEGGTMELGYGASIVGSGNHILHYSSPHTVVLSDYDEGNTAVIDLRNNYWGTPDTNLVAYWIWDGHDDPNIHAVVDYLPIEPAEVPTEHKSLGGLKALFR